MRTFSSRESLLSTGNTTPAIDKLCERILRASIVWLGVFGSSRTGFKNISRPSRATGAFEFKGICHENSINHFPNRAFILFLHSDFAGGTIAGRVYRLFRQRHTVFERQFV
jgi:hypothetical protein